MQPGGHFHPAIALFGVLVPAALFFVWRAWFDASTRAERLGTWVRLSILGPYVGAVLVGIITYFTSEEFENWRANPQTPTASGLLLPLALVTVIPGLMFLRYSMFIAAPVVLIFTLFIPKGAHRPLDI
jgi:predicted membrane protein